jgi:hypothetical protein
MAHDPIVRPLNLSPVARAVARVCGGYIRIHPSMSPFAYLHRSARMRGPWSFKGTRG